MSKNKDNKAVEHMVDWIILNYSPRITKNEIMWNLDGAEALYTTEEAVLDYYEHNPPTPNPEPIQKDELADKLIYIITEGNVNGDSYQNIKENVINELKNNNQND